MADAFLWLIRHGKAAPAAQFASDPERPLTARGRADAGRIRDWMLSRHADAMPRLWVASPALRTRETAELLAGDGEVALAPELYAAWTDDFLRVVGRTPATVPSAAFVGHNPTVASLVRALAGETAMLAPFPTLTTALFRLPGGWQRPDLAELVDRTTPKQLA